MTNPHKGEVGFTADGKEWVLSYSANALCTLEEEFDQSTNELLAEMDKAGDKVRMTTLRVVFWAGLQDHHKDVTKEQAGEIMTNAGFDVIGPLIGKALRLAFPKGDAGKKPRPPKGGKAGTGNGS